MNQIMKRIWNGTTTVLIGAIVILAILLCGIRILGYEIFVVQSGSMEPDYHVGSLVYVKPMDSTKLVVGDVITFRLSGSTLATHRIMEVVEQDGEMAFRTKGDANDHPDNGLVKPSSVVGKVMFSVPYLGYVTAYIQNPPGLYVAVCIAAVVLLLTVLPEIIFNDKKKS